MRRTTRLSHRLLSLLLCLSMVLSYVPAMAPPAVAAPVVTDPADKVVDADTRQTWQDGFINLNGELSSRYAGGVWTDKSVYQDPMNLYQGGQITLDADRDSFLVALSALASNYTISGQSSVPTDTILVLDASNSMNEGTRLEKMVEASNLAIDKLLGLNSLNRVGVVLYGGSDGESTASSILLPLGRYTTQQATYVELSGSTLRMNTNVRIEGTNTSPTSSSMRVDSATYTQQGIMRAVEMFQAVTDTTATDPLSKRTINRVPITILLSDGAPSLGQSDFTNPMKTNNIGTGRTNMNERTWERLAFVTQLTIAYAKTQINAKYHNNALLYTVGLEVGNDARARSVMDPANSTTSLTTNWQTFMDLPLGGRMSLGDSVYVTKPASFPSVDFLQKNYANQYFAATDSDSDGGLADAFEQILHEIEAQSAFFPTLVTESADTSGFVSFADNIGKYMEVINVKGIVLHGMMYDGHNLAKTAVSGDLGSATSPTPLGDEFIWAVKERLGITDTYVAQELVRQAYESGQLYYNSDADYSNYIGWYGDADGNYLGFYHDGVTNLVGTGAVYTYKSYGYLGQTDASLGVESSDMMYATVHVRTEIATGQQAVAFAVPAALIPTITYDILLDGDGNLLDLTAQEYGVNPDGTQGEPIRPIRLVYEVALQEGITPYTLSFLDPTYLAEHTDPATGKVWFYTNAWELDSTGTVTKPTGPGTTPNTISHFTPSVENMRYYFVEDMPVYVPNGSGGYEVYTGGENARPTTGYRTFEFYTKADDGTLDTREGYHALSQETLAKAQWDATKGWYIPRGTVYTNLEGFNLPKADNTTGTALNYTVPFVMDGGTAQSYITGAVHGNNGRLALMPETGLKITKTVTGTATTKAFVFNVANQTEQTHNGPHNYLHLAADGSLVAQGTLQCNNGSFQVSLADGESFYIFDLEPGHVYTVAEQVDVDYVPDAPSKDITVEEGKVAEVNFTNSDRGKGNLTVAKNVVTTETVDATALDALDFLFQITLSGIGVGEPNQSYEIEHNVDVDAVTTATIQAQADGTVEVTLGHNEQIEFLNLPAGTQATVVETTKTGFEAKYFDDGVAGDGQVTVDAGEITSVLVENVHNPLDTEPPTNISVSGIKNFTGREWLDSDTFTFELQRYDAEESATAGQEVWEVRSTQTVKGSDPDTGNPVERAFNFDQAFAQVTYDKAGTYIYRVVEIIPADDEKLVHVTYARTVHSFTVHVGDPDLDGKLQVTDVTTTRPDTVEITEYPATATTPLSWDVNTTFYNTYSNTDTATIAIDLNKAVVNPSGSPLAVLSGFKFQLEPTAVVANDPVPAVGLETAVTNDRGFARIPLTYTHEGIYEYTLTELQGTESGWIYSGESYLVTVVVTDSHVGDNNLTAVVYVDGNSTGATDSTAVTFTNTYDPVDTSLDVDTFVSKAMTGREILAGEFTFQVLDEQNNVVLTGTNLAGVNGVAAVDFNGVLSFDKVGTYAYYVMETSTDGNGVTTDKTRFTFTVTVTDVDGILEASYVVTGVAGNQIQFQNTYTAAPVEFVPTAVKVMTGRPLLPNEFRFNVTDANGNIVLKGLNDPDTDGDGDGEVSFYNVDSNGNIIQNSAGILTFDQAGTYTYTITESVATEVNGVTYDPHSVTMTVKVIDNGQGNLVVDEVTYTKDGSSNQTGATFNNAYRGAPVDVVLQGGKALINQDLKAEQFSFELYSTDSTWTTRSLVATVKNRLDGTFVFPTMTYSTVGTRYYIIKEVIPTDVNNGITYDTTEYHVTVTVTDNNIGNLLATVVYWDEDLATDAANFTNTYTVSDGETLTLSGQKYLTGRNEPIQSGEFSFELTNPKILDNNGVDVTNLRPLRVRSNNANGQYSFVLDFPASTVGWTITYELREQYHGQTREGVTYSDVVYTIIVKPVDDQQGGMILNTTILRDGVDVTANVNPTELNFTNTYTAAPTTAQIVGTKGLVNKTLAADQFSFALYNATVSNNVWTEGTLIETVQNAANGDFAFTALPYTKTGSYYYLVKEVVPADAVNNIHAGIHYDTSVYKIRVDVTDNNDGQLVSNVVIVEPQKASVQFGNIYEIRTPTSLTIHGTKTLTGRGIKAGETFTFELLKGENKVGEATVTGPVAAGVAESFSIDLSYSSLKDVGIHEYTLREVAPASNSQGMTYERDWYWIEVQVTDNGDGTLSATLLRMCLNGRTGTEITGAPPVAPFVNEYDTVQNKVVLEGTKTLENNNTGRPLTDGEFMFELYEEGNSTPLATTAQKNGKFTFERSYTLADAGKTFTYIIRERKGTEAGMVYDEHYYKAVVTVTDNGDGTLNVSTPVITKHAADGTQVTGSAIAFENEYAPAPVSLAIPGTKQLSGMALTAGAFSFELYNADAAWTQGSLIESVQNAADGSFAFAAISYTEVGTHYYLVKEAKGGTTDKGITYDGTVYRVRVGVTDTDFDGKLEASYTVVNGSGNAVVFRNQYVVTGDTTVTLSGSKTLTGRDLLDGEFVFVLKNTAITRNGVDISPLDADQTDSNLNGKFSFTMSYDADDVGKVYTYTVSEQNSGKGGIAYDATVYTVTVTVTDEAGKVVATPVVTGGTAIDALNFSNTYTVTGQKDVTLTGLKNLTGKNLAAGEFTFVLTQTSPAVTPNTWTTTNDGAGSFQFDLSFFPADVGKTFTYTVTELNTGKGGIGYDTKVYDVTIVVGHDGLGNITTDVTIVGGPMEFNNTYTLTGGASVTLTGNKTLTGRALNVGEFTFGVYENGALVTSGTNQADGSYAIVLNYVPADIGTHVYTVKELNEGKGGVDYDSKSYTVTVVVADDGNGGITAAITSMKLNGADVTSLDFANTYTTKPASVVFSGTKTLENNNTGRPLTDGEFMFELYEEGNPTPLATTAQKNGAFTFERSYTLADAGKTFTYIIRERKGTEAGMTYDEHYYKAVVTVTDSGDGTLNVSTPVITKHAADGTQVTGSEIAFANVYAPAPVELDIPGTKQLSGMALTAGAFSFELYNADAAWTQGTLVETVQNDANGKYTFTALPTYTEVGTHYYLVKEAKGGTTDKGITYDATVYQVRVDVTDTDFDGKLEASYTVVNGSGNAIVFRNQYVITGGDVVELSGSKTLNGRPLIDGEFTFVLTNTAITKNGVALSPLEATQTVTNSNGGFLFSLAYGPEDVGKVYTYTISEQGGTKGGITYDDTVYTVTVTVTDVDGQVVATPVVTGGTAADALNFTNTYTVSGQADVTLKGNKTLTGMALAGNDFTFVLTQTAPAVTPNTWTVQNDAQGNFQFDLSFFPEDVGKTFTYTVTEQAGSNAGIAYDKKVYDVTIVVGHDGLGKITTDVTVTGGPIEFSNTYTVTGDAFVTLSGNKTLTGRTLNAGEFTFEVYENGALVTSGTNGADGSFSIRLDYVPADIGTHVYTVKESKANALGGVTYDGTEYEVTVVVADDGNGGITATVTSMKLSGADVTSLDFANTYTTEPASITFGGTKTLTTASNVDRALGSSEFFFELYELADENDTVGKLVAKTTQDASGSYSFSPVSYTLADAGKTFYYMVKEQSGSASYFTYSTVVHKIKVEVTDNGDGTLNVTSTVLGGTASDVQELNFENQYQVVNPKGLVLEGTKTLTGRDMVGGEFSFVLTQTAPVSDPVNTWTVTNGADGKFRFQGTDAPTYGEADVGKTYTYTVTEVKGSTSGMTYSTAVYTVNVVVGHDGMGNVTTDVTVEGNAPIVFENLYETVGSVTISGGKTLTGRDMNPGETFTFKLYEGSLEVGTATVQGGKKGLEEAFSITVDYATMADVGVHEYILREVRTTTGWDGITYDPNAYWIKVLVTDGNNGVLTATIEEIRQGGANGAVVTAISFVNIYDPTQANLVLEGDKTLADPANTGRKLSSGEFTFELYELTAQGETLIGSTANGANGAFKFGIPYRLEDLDGQTSKTFTYVIREKQETVAGIRYTTDYYWVQVTVTDDLNGTLVLSEPIIKRNGPDGIQLQTGERMVFENAYEPLPVPAVIGGTKKLSGKELTAGMFSFQLYTSNELGEELAPIGAPVVNAADGSFTFEPVQHTVTGTYYYLVKEISGGTTDKGITYDDAQFLVKVVVTDVDFDGQLEAVTTVVNGTNGSVVFVNKYEVTGNATVTIGGDKALTGGRPEELRDGEFTFILTNTNIVRGGLEVRPLENPQTTTNVDGKFTFDLTYEPDDIGNTYTYTVTEQNAGKTIAGITYATTVYEIQVVVEDNGEGGIKTTVTEASGRDTMELDFVNSYEAADVQAVIEGTKTLNVIHGIQSLKPNMFTFELYASDVSWNKGSLLATAQNLADGSFAFPAQTFSAVGTYYFLVQEANGGQTIDGITYDAAVWQVTVTVTDNSLGQLVAAVQYGTDGQSMTFNNTYNVTPTEELVIEGTKVLTGIKALEAGMFEFGLYQYGENWSGEGVLVGQTVTNDVYGNFAFDAITYDKTGTYYYQVLEIAPADGNGMTYDRTVYKIQVTVQDNGRGKLIATAELVDADRILFTNNYTTEDTEPVVIEGKKVLTGYKALVEGMFTFELYEADAAWAPLNSTPIASVQNAADGTFAFPAMTYGESQIGKHYYLVKEANGGQTIDGIIYSDVVYRITVEVTDNGNGKLVTTVTYADEVAELVFTNDYVITGTAQVTLDGTKTLTGRTLADGEFTFVLTNTDTLETQEVTNADGTFQFVLTYQPEDVGKTYTYTVTEKNNELGGVTYDETIYEVTVMVSHDGKGSITTQVTVAGDAPIAFENTYTTADASTTLTGTKELTGRDMIDGEFTFELYNEQGEKIAETTNENGAFTFTLTYGLADVGEHQYTVKELNTAKGGVSYDKTVYDVTVTVTDNGDGTLDVQQSITEDGVAAALVFQNTYNTAEAVTTIEGTKTLTGRDMANGEFTFELLDDKGEKLAETTNLDGKFSFELKYRLADVGVHTYTVKELDTAKGGVSYDKTVYTVIVTVTDNGDGTLKVEKVLKQGNAVVEALAFTNTYTAKAVGVTLEGTKALTGRELKAGEFRFDLYQADESFKPAEQPVAQATNTADGTFKFATQTFSEVGTYYFVVKEDTTVDVSRITFDETVYHVTVEVTDDGVGSLVAKVQMTKADGTAVTAMGFSNVFTPKPDDLKLPIKVEKYVVNEGSKVMGPEGFQFVLENTETGKKATVKSDKNGLASFSLTYSEEDIGKTFSYKLYETKGDKAHVTYSTLVYSIQVKITLGADNKLVATVNMDGTAVKEAVGKFENIYDYTPEVPKTGDETNLMPYILMMTISLGGILVLLKKERKERSAE